MPTIYLEAEIEVRVFLKDHEPPHVHVVKDKATVVIDLGDQDVRPSISRNYGMKAADVKKALKIVAEHQGVFLQEWRKYHGQK